MTLKKVPKPENQSTYNSLKPDTRQSYITCQPSFNQDNSKTSLYYDEFENNSQSVKTDKSTDNNQSNKTLHFKNLSEPPSIKLFTKRKSITSIHQTK